jgi:hypothetical protein
MIKRVLPNILIIIASILVTYVLSDIGFRIIRYTKLRNGYEEYYFQGIDAPLYVFDQELGYRYQPNTDGHYANFDKDNSVLQLNQFRVNNAGHISPTDDFIAKPNSEFRIAILGDSYTASIHNNVPWPSILEDILKKDDGLKQRLGKTSFKVINFGMDGTGIVQWDKVAAIEVARYHPDLVIVNFITDDIFRKHIWWASIKPQNSTGDYYLGLICSSPPVSLANRDCAVSKTITFDRATFDDKNELSRIKKEIYYQEVNRIDWFSLYPELFARTLGRFIGLKDRLFLSGQQIPYYEHEDDAVKASENALYTIQSIYPNTLFLHNPDPPELLSQSTPQVVLDLVERDSDLHIQLMRKSLPSQADGNEIRSWFKLPRDGHFSDYGASIYAQSVYSQVRERLLHSAVGTQ